MKPEKLAVVLFNLGGPSEEAAIRPFLFNFFMDKNIITAPLPVRFLIALWISWSRSRGAAKEAYSHLGGKSPLLENTKKQADALEKSLQEKGVDARVFISMRYWHPRAAETVKEVAAFRPDKIVLLPLYPQYSTTTTLSSIQDWRQAAEKEGLAIPASVICCYPDNDGFISASAALIGPALEEAPKKVRLLFSAHGLPEKIIEGGDPYQYQCERTAAAIVEKLGIPLLDWQICYQSRIGRLKWTGPSTIEALEKASEDAVAVVIYPLAFVSEHVETMVEIDMEYHERATRMGVHYFDRVLTAGTHPDFIEGLQKLVLSRVNGVECSRRCPEKFSRCYCGEKNA